MPMADYLFGICAKKKCIELLVNKVNHIVHKIGFLFLQPQ